MKVNENTYKFQSGVLAEAAYEMLPFKQRHVTHLELAKLYETRGGQAHGMSPMALYGLLAHHYVLGTNG